MQEKTYNVQLKRRKGRWVATVPDLPADAPTITTSALGNLSADMTVELAEYLGVHESMLNVRVPHPVRPERPRLRDRVTHGAVQLTGGGVLLSGVYLAAGAAATLIAAGIGIAAVATGKEAGWL